MRKEIKINDKGDTIPIDLVEEEGVFYIDVDGVEWVETEAPYHAAVLFDMMADHLGEYMHYEKI